MAASSKKGKKSKGKTVNLSDFLNEGPATTVDGKAVVTLKTNWADEVDENEDIYPAPTERVALPTAPRAARQEIDPSKIPDQPPYTAYVGNLSYDVDEDALSQFFTQNMKLRVNNARLVRDNGRMKGYGYVEFSDKQSLVDAFKADGEMLMARKIKVDLATQSGNRERDGGFGERREGRGGAQITGEGDADDDWRTSAAATPSYDTSNSYGRSREGYGGRGRDERDGGFGAPRDRYEGPSEADTVDSWSRGPPRGTGQDDGGSSGGFGSRRGYDERDSGYSRGGGYNRDRDFNRDSGYNRDSGFGGRRDGRYNSAYRGGPGQSGYRDGYSSGPSAHHCYNRDGRYDDRHSGYDRQPSSETPKERPRLQLAPRSKPAEGTSVSTAPAATSVFGGAKPVDTAAREREIEERRNKKQDESRDSSFGARDIRTNMERRVYNAADDNDRPRDDMGRRGSREEPRQNGRDEPRPVQPVKKPTSASIFGGAKPVDTSARDREIAVKHHLEHPSSSSDDRRYDNRDREYSRESSRDGPSRDGPYRDGPSRDGPSRDGPYRDGPSRDGPSRDGPYRDGPSRDGPYRDGPSRDGPYRDGPSRDGPYRDGPSRDGLSRDGPSRDGPSRDGPSRDGPPRDAPPKANAWNKGPPASQQQRPVAVITYRRPRKEKKERQLPQSIDDMPQYKETEGRDFSDQNKYAGLLASDGEDRED